MSKISSSIKNLWSKFTDPDYRRGFVEDTIADSLAVQIQAMRRMRNWTQAELGERAGTPQSGVCRWESSEPPAKISTLAKIAAAFDVALVVKFIPYSEFLIGDGEPADRDIPPFSQDRLPEFDAIQIQIDGQRRTDFIPVRHVKWTLDLPIFNTGDLPIFNTGRPTNRTTMQ